MQTWTCDWGEIRGTLPGQILEFVGTIALVGSLAAAQSDPLVVSGATWSYLDDGSDQGSSWSGLAYDDSTWGSGASQLGYGDGDDETTLVDFGSDEQDKHITTYFRHEFTVADSSVYQALSLRLLRDDGAVMFLNGVEVLRSNMPGGVVDFETRAALSALGTEEDLFYPLDLDASLLVDGVNLLAVEVHLRSPSSPDLSFDAELVAHRDPLLSRGPYLQRGTETGVTFRWRTFPASDAQVWFGTAPGMLTSVASDGTVESDHQIKVQGLLPDTRYYYAVGSSAGPLAGDDAEHFFVTHPVAGESRPFRAWILGDSGTADDSARAVRDAYQARTGTAHTDLWLMLGDNAYKFGTDSEYEAAVFDMYPEMLRKSVLWSTRGNHDSSGGTYYGIFTHPKNGESGGLASGSEAFYSFDYANVHFICLDSLGSDASEGGAMWLWLQGDLSTTDQDWIVAFWHHPPYSKGSHDSDTGESLAKMRENFLPLLERGGVDAVFAGHSHSYERSFLIDGHYGDSTTLVPGMILDGGSGRESDTGAYNKSKESPSGTVYTVAGSSGKTTQGPFGHPVMFTSLVKLGSVVLEVDGGRLSASFVDDAGLIADHWTLLRESYTGSFCAAEPSSAGCVAQMNAIGTPSVTDPAPFLLNAEGVNQDKNGLLFYGYEPNNVPFFNGRLCVKAPLTRSALQNSGAGSLPCMGSFSYDFNAHIQGGTDAGLVVGATVYAQYWFRDGAGIAALSDGYQFVIEL